MKNKFYKKVFLGLVIIMVLGMLSTGCAPAPTAPPYTPPPVQTCTLTVYSQHPWCWGYVWVNGLSTGVWISQNGMASVTGLTAGSTASVAIHDQFGAVSHSEILVLQAGNNIVIFDSWF